jgi:predicted DNA-binding ribbon-helix-helix protein
MSTLTIRLPDTKHERLKAFARTRGVSVNKLVEELATVALAQADAENRYLISFVFYRYIAPSSGMQV